MPFPNRLILLALTSLFPIPNHPGSIAGTLVDYEQVGKVTPCFVPGHDCQQQIIDVIDAARHDLLIQAYSFTSAPIAQALVRAERRGVKVTAILDKSQRSERYSGARFLINAGIPVWIDDRPAIAHNKVIVADERITVTGSFNFTKAAQERNAENIVVIDDPRIAAAYRQNIQARLGQSEPLE
jgi:phosphatidylserine/phosphatidylglycerophosphate/cardiolipin synthase-like enzyme